MTSPPISRSPFLPVSPFSVSPRLRVPVSPLTEAAGAALEEA